MTHLYNIINIYLGSLHHQSFDFVDVVCDLNAISYFIAGFSCLLDNKLNEDELTAIEVKYNANERPSPYVP